MANVSYEYVGLIEVEPEGERNRRFSFGALISNLGQVCAFPNSRGASISAAMWVGASSDLMLLHLGPQVPAQCHARPLVRGLLVCLPLLACFGKTVKQELTSQGRTQRPLEEILQPNQI